MKKMIMAVLALAMVMGLTGCSDAYTNISDAKAELFTVNGTTITKGDIYPMLLNSSGLDVTLDMLLEHIMDIEVPMGDAELAKAKEDFKELKEGYGESFSFVLSYYGYENEDQFYEEAFLPQQQSIMLTAKYVETKFDTLSVTQKPRKVQIIQFTDKETAKTAYERVFTNKEDFKAVAAELGTSAFDGSEIVITTATSIDAALLARLTETTVSKKIEEVVEGTDGKFYVANVVEGDPENFREEACDAIAASSAVTSDATRYFLQQYDFKISDKDVYELYKAEYPDYIFD